MGGKKSKENHVLKYPLYQRMTKIKFKKVFNGRQISILKAAINSFLVQMDKY